MFVTKTKHKALVKRFLRLEKACESINTDLIMAEADVKINRAALRDTMKALLLLNKKTQNLTEIVKLLPTNKERKKVIAESKDGTKITIGDVLDSEDLIPRIEDKCDTSDIDEAIRKTKEMLKEAEEEEYQSAII